MEKQNNLFNNNQPKQNLFSKSALENLATLDDLDELCKTAKIYRYYYIFAVLLAAAALLIVILKLAKP